MALVPRPGALFYGEDPTMAAKRKQQANGRKKRSRNTGRRWVLLILFSLVVIGLSAVYLVFGSNTGAMAQEEFLYIRTGADFEEVKQELKKKGMVRNMWSFSLLAERANYPNRVVPGKYRIERGMSNYRLVRLLRSGQQTPVRLVVPKLRTKQDLARVISSNLEADSVSVMALVANQEYLNGLSLDTNTALCAILPDTYEFYWNTNAEKAFAKIHKNSARFWNEERVAKAHTLGLSPIEIIVLASIVEEETNLLEEKPIIASVYLNRLKKRMKLQADPTARFAFGDFTIRRITIAQTSIPSPYNTYFTFGLPPGPICTPSAATIQAVLDAPATDYLYFCASGDGSGRHLFANSYQEHLQNARAYHRMLNERGVR